jgi:two-component system cell cycle response regulator
MKILIAEDDVTSRTILTEMLIKHGYEVTATVNGTQAWQAMQQPDAPLIAILDWMMPGIDGVEVCRRVRALKAEQRPHIIILTVRGEKADIVAGLEAGADDYLCKPFDPGELRARLDVGRRLIEMQDKLLDARNELSQQAMRDPLTGILNRRAITEALSIELFRQQRQYKGLALGLCDIDTFKKINDTHGHLVGDEVLCGFVRLLAGRLRPYDFLGRFGGDEFVVVAPDMNEKDARIFYDRLRATVADSPIPTAAGAVSITISIGVKIWGENQTADELLVAADTALYQAKSQGRNCVCLAD